MDGACTIVRCITFIPIFLWLPIRHSLQLINRFSQLGKLFLDPAPATQSSPDHRVRTMHHEDLLLLGSREEWGGLIMAWGWLERSCPGANAPEQVFQERETARAEAVTGWASIPHLDGSLHIQSGLLETLWIERAAKADASLHATIYQRGCALWKERS